MAISNAVRIAHYIKQNNSAKLTARQARQVRRMKVRSMARAGLLKPKAKRSTTVPVITGDEVTL